MRPMISLGLMSCAVVYYTRETVEYTVLRLKKYLVVVSEALYILYYLARPGSSMMATSTDPYVTTIETELI
jgi:hypothetical protein